MRFTSGDFSVCLFFCLISTKALRRLAGDRLFGVMLFLLFWIFA
jgi:hypothetical protein